MLDQSASFDARTSSSMSPPAPLSVVVVPEAVVLAAGPGSRLRTDDDAPPKPLTPVLGRPLIERSIDALSRAGVERVTVVVGFEGEVVAAALDEIARPYEVGLTVVESPEWELGNGASALAATDHVGDRFYLTMGDHLFEQTIPQTLADEDGGAALALAVDYDCQAVPDVAEATKVRVDGRAIIDIGKELTSFDAIDTGIFLCRPAIFDALVCARAAGDHSVSGAVRVLAERGDAVATPVTGRFWQDIDTPRDVRLAERRLRAHDRADAHALPI